MVHQFGSFESIAIYKAVTEGYHQIAFSKPQRNGGHVTIYGRQTNGFPTFYPIKYLQVRTDRFTRKSTQG